MPYSPARLLFSRIFAWLRRNPSARADALELAAASLLERAASASTARAARMHWRASLYRDRARQLREKARG